MNLAQALATEIARVAKSRGRNAAYSHSIGRAAEKSYEEKIKNLQDELVASEKEKREYATALARIGAQIDELYRLVMGKDYEANT